MKKLPQKMKIVRARVSTAMKRDLAKLAVMREEAESVLIREALRLYIRQEFSQLQTKL
jgi:predicted transcriptional regulator